MTGLYGRVRQMVTGLNLKSGSELYQVVFDTAAAGMVTINSDGVIQACNPALCRMFGYGISDLLGQNISLLMPASHAGHHQHYIERYLSGKGAADSVMGRGREVTARRCNGDTFLIHLTVSEMNLAGARSFTAIVHDLSDTIPASPGGHAQQLDRAWLGTVMDQTPAAVTVKDMQGRYLLLNSRAEQMLRISSRDAVGRTDAELFPAQWALLQQRTDDEVSRAAGPRVFIEPYNPGTRQGEEISFLSSKNLLRDAGGNAVGIVSVALDISALPVINRPLHTSEVQLLNALPHPLALLSADGEVLQANEAYAQRFGMSARSVLGCQIRLLEADVMVERFERLLSGDPSVSLSFTEGSWQFQLQVYRWQQQKLIVLSAVPLEDIQPQQVVTDTVAGESNLQFVAALSHELRTPLNAVIGFSQLLKPELKEEDQIEAIEMIERAGKHLVSLVDQVLDLIKVEGNVTPLHTEAVSVNAIIRECVELVTQEAQAKGIVIRTESQLSEPWIQADRVRCKQILLNLLTNAIKYNGDNGRVDIRIRRGKEGYLHIAVSDTGPGLSAAQQQVLFRPFQRLGAEQNGVEGTGLGLSICRVLTEQMQGEIGVFSEPGEGSCFWFELPSASPLYSFRPRLAAEHNRTAVHNCRVLYIEDNLASARYVELGLKRRENIDVVIARTGREGVSMAQDQQPDVILLDMRLPDSHGLDVLKKLRALPELTGARIYGVSAEALPDQIADARSAGLDGYMTKPFDLNALSNMIDCAAARSG